MSKAGPKLIQHTLSLSHANSTKIETRDEFFWPMDMTASRVRTGGGRIIEEIDLMEIRQAALICLRSAVGISHDDLVREVGKLFGFNRAGTRIFERISLALSGAVCDEVVRLQNRVYTLASAE